MTRDWDIRRRRRRRLNGLCQDCEEPAVEGSYCKEHAERKRRNSARNTQRRKDNNLCLGCGSPLSEFDILLGNTGCDVCRVRRSVQKGGAL